jgi:hypothetical protein
MNKDEEAGETLICKARLLGAHIRFERTRYMHAVLYIDLPKGMRFVFNHGPSLWCWSGNFGDALALFEQGVFDYKE